MVEPIFATLEPLEQLSVFTPLGIRFWDPARDVAVSDGLVVTARQPGLPARPRRAFLTSSGVYAFQDLPGLSALAHAPLSSPPATLRFLIEVRDELERFLPAVFFVDAPYFGIFPTRGAQGLLVGSPPVGSPPLAGPPGFYLFSAPARPASATLALVRAQLEELRSALPRRPAGHAVLVVQPVGQPPAYGVADERGALAVQFPYPRFTSAAGSGSHPGNMPQAWDVAVSVLYAPTDLAYPPGSRLPDLRSVFRQAAGLLWTSPGSPGQPVASFSEKLVFGQELVLRSAGESVLLVGAAASPP